MQLVKREITIGAPVERKNHPAAADELPNLERVQVGVALVYLRPRHYGGVGVVPRVDGSFHHPVRDVVRVRQIKTTDVRAEGMGDQGSSRDMSLNNVQEQSDHVSSHVR